MYVDIDIDKINRELATKFRISTLPKIRMFRNRRFFTVYNDFYFRDGDGIAVELTKHNGGWVYSDIAHTIFHMRILYGDRTEPISVDNVKNGYLDRLKLEYGIEEIVGEELIHKIPDGQFAESLSQFIQGLLYIVRTFEVLMEDY